MGAIWDFISGKSTDWDKFDREQAESAERAREYRESHPREYIEQSSHNKYYAYCKICGAMNGSRGAYEDSPSKAIKTLQRSSSGCGENNHIPEVVEGKMPD